MIKTIECDILKSGADIICHQVNCQGVMGSGLAKQIKDTYPNVYSDYRELVQEYDESERHMLLGRVQYVEIPSTKARRYIANCFGQNYYGRDKRYTNYRALRDCFEQIYFTNNSDIQRRNIAIPYCMGCGLAGGDWDVVYKMIKDAFFGYRWDVLICKYKQ